MRVNMTVGLYEAHSNASNQTSLPTKESIEMLYANYACQNADCAEMHGGMCGIPIGFKLF